MEILNSISNGMHILGKEYKEVKTAKNVIMVPIPERGEAFIRMAVKDMKV